MFEQLFQWLCRMKYNLIFNEVQKSISLIRFWGNLSKREEVQIKCRIAEEYYVLTNGYSEQQDWGSALVCGESVINYWNELKPIFKL